MYMKFKIIIYNWYASALAALCNLLTIATVLEKILATYVHSLPY